ncbi:MAG TPA: CDP-alcohol phosphatidyltransferase family protein [Bacteroidota bacterium]|nr:CDP-alcohol phosphatidyltransferase family protein [Bacteroidota bacterium]
MRLIPPRLEKWFSTLLDRVVPLLCCSFLRPNIVSGTGCFFHIAAGILLFRGYFFPAGVLILLGGILDLLDGKLARLTRRDTAYGAVFDATMDRAGELAMYLGIGGYFVVHRMVPGLIVTALATAGSFMVSYVRARAESYNIPCGIGVLRRPDRILLIGLGALTNALSLPIQKPVLALMPIISVPHRLLPVPLIIALLIIAVLAPVTVAQRLRHVRRWQSLLLP